MGKKTQFITAVVLIALLGSIATVITLNPDRLRYELAIYRAKSYYRANYQYIIPLDSHKLLTLAIDKKPSLADAKISELLRHSENPHNPFYRWNFQYKPTPGFSMERLASEDALANFTTQDAAAYFNDFYEVPEEFRQYMPHHWDDVMLKAIYCDLLGYDDTDFNFLLALPDRGGGYADTHVFQSLLFLRANNCYDNHKINQELDRLAASMLAALETDTFYRDLYAERLAFLYWGGYGGQIKAEWINNIRQSQEKNGGWRDEKGEINPHTTGFAVLSLIYYHHGQTQYPFW